MLVDREGFSKELQRVKPALASGGVVQELSHIWFDKKSIAAYDGGFGIQLKMDSELSCGVPGSVLLALLATSPLKEAGLETADALLSIKLGRSNSKVGILELERKVWPFPGKLPRNAKFSSLDENFIEALRKTLFVKASPPTRVEHHGILVQKEKKDLGLYSTDSVTMARAHVKGAGASATFEKVLLPRSFAEQIVSQSPEGVDLYVLDDCLIAVGEGVTFYSNLLDISGADDLGAIFARMQKSHPEPVALPAGLQEALDRAVILAGRKDEPLVSLSVDGAVLKLFGDYGLGKIDESLEIEGEHPKGKIRLRASHIGRALPFGENISITKESLLLLSPGFAYVVASL